MANCWVAPPWNVVGLAGGHEVEGHHGELLGGAALEEADLVVVGDLHQPPQTGLGVLDDLLEPFAAVAHLHHALAAAVVVEQFDLRGLEDGFGQHAGPGAEIVYSCHIGSLHCILRPKGLSFAVDRT